MPKIKDLPKFLRPREKLFEKGPDALKDYELLAILLRTGYKGKSAVEVAKRLLKTSSIANMSKLSFKELAKIKGVGKSRASSIIAALELSNRVVMDNEIITITNPTDAIKIVSFIKDKKREYFVALYLDAKKHLLKVKTISVGILDTSLVHPREVFAPAINCHAAEVILAHNHPSNSSAPSTEDIDVTINMHEAGEILGIELIDHLIITRDSFASIKELGYFPVK